MSFITRVQSPFISPVSTCVPYLHIALLPVLSLAYLFSSFTCLCNHLSFHPYIPYTRPSQIFSSSKFHVSLTFTYLYCMSYHLHTYSLILPVSATTFPFTLTSLTHACLKSRQLFTCVPYLYIPSLPVLSLTYLFSSFTSLCNHLSFHLYIPYTHLSQILSALLHVSLTFTYHYCLSYTPCMLILAFYLPLQPPFISPL